MLWKGLLRGEAAGFLNLDINMYPLSRDPEMVPMCVCRRLRNWSRKLECGGSCL